MGAIRTVRTVILAVALCGCSQTQELTFYQTVPADAPVIAAIDLDESLKMAGCGFRSGVITLTPDLQTVLASADSALLSATEAVAAMGGRLDLSQSVAFVTPQSKSLMLTAPLRINAIFTEPVMTEYRSAALGQCKVYDCGGGMALLATKQQGWMACMDADELGHAVDEALDCAQSAALEQHPRLLGFLQGDGLARVCINFGHFKNPVGDDFAAALLCLTALERSVAIEGNAIDQNDEKVAPFSLLLPIEPQSLQAMPDGSIAATAIGVKPATIYDIAKRAPQMTLKGRLAFDAIVGMMSADGGTIAVGCSPGGSAETISKFDLDNWLIKAMLPFGVNAEPAAELIDQFLSDRLYSESVGSYLAVTNYDPEYYPAQCDMWPDRQGTAHALLTATVPYQSETMKALKIKNGYELEVWCTDSVASAHLRLLGPSQYLATAMIKDLAKRLRPAKAPAKGKSQNKRRARRHT